MMNPQENFSKASTVPAEHLAAIAHFASRAVIPHEVAMLPERAKGVLPSLDKFVDGDRSEEIVEDLKERFPKIADSLRALAAEIERLPRGLPDAVSSALWDMCRLLHAGAHIEAVVWGLFPGHPEAHELENGRSWGGAILDHNLECSRSVLEEATKVIESWNHAQALARAYKQ